MLHLIIPEEVKYANDHHRSGHLQPWSLLDHINILISPIGVLKMEPPQIFHVRCSCGGVVVKRQQAFLDALNKGLSSAEAMREANIRSWCCLKSATTPYTLPGGVRHQSEELEKQLNMVSTTTFTQASSAPKGIISKIKYPDVPSVPLKVVLQNLEPDVEPPPREIVGREKWTYAAR